MPLPIQTLGSWVRIQLEADPLTEESYRPVCKINIFWLTVNENRPERLIGQGRRRGSNNSHTRAFVCVDLNAGRNEGADSKNGDSRNALPQSGRGVQNGEP
jgi:hypothetical protein